MQLTVTNHGSDPLYVTILSVAEDRAVNVIWGQDRNNLLRPSDFNAPIAAAIETVVDPTTRCMGSGVFHNKSGITMCNWLHLSLLLMMLLMALADFAKNTHCADICCHKTSDPHATPALTHACECMGAQCF